MYCKQIQKTVAQSYEIGYNNTVRCDFAQKRRNILLETTRTRFAIKAFSIVATSRMQTRNAHEIVVLQREQLNILCGCGEIGRRA